MPETPVDKRRRALEEIWETGRSARTIEPHSEADIAALLGQFLVAFGKAVGSRPHFMAESDRHGVNLNGVFVGKTAKGRKGISWGHVRRVMATADPDWNDRIMNGLSSGEGLIWQVRDPIMKRDPIRKIAASLAMRRSWPTRA